MKHSQPFDFRNMAKLIFIVNKIPESNDQSYDNFRRWIMLFEKTFQGVDTSHIEELTNEEELLGLSNPAIFFLQAPLNYKIVACRLKDQMASELVALRFFAFLSI